MKFNYNLFKELSDDILYYMPAQNDWRSPRADSYQLYDLDTPNGIATYNTSFPKWREQRVYIFDEIRRLVEVPEPKKIHRINFVKHTDSSFSVPIHTEGRMHYYFMMKASADIVLVSRGMSDAVKHMSHPQNDYDIIPYGQPESAYSHLRRHKARKGDCYSVGNRWTSILYPKKDTLYFYVETDTK
jgi:hypothetical protein